MRDTSLSHVKTTHSRLRNVDVSLWDAKAPDSMFVYNPDEQDWRWITICEKHSTICAHETRRMAEWHMPTVDWCEACIYGEEEEEEDSGP